MKAKKKGLGKGLSALFGDQKKPKNIDKIEANDQKALIGELTRNKYQPRTIFDETKLEELSKSIKKYSDPAIKNHLTYCISLINNALNTRLS